MHVRTRLWLDSLGYGLDRRSNTLAQIFRGDGPANFRFPKSPLAMGR
jgi:hypothetical protein